MALPGGIEPSNRWVAGPIPAWCGRFAQEMQITVDFDRSFSPDDAKAQWNQGGEEER